MARAELRERGIAFLVRCCIRAGRSYQEALRQAHEGYGYLPDVEIAVRANYKDPNQVDCK